MHQGLRTIPKYRIKREKKYSNEILTWIVFFYAFYEKYKII